MCTRACTTCWHVVPVLNVYVYVKMYMIYFACILDYYFVSVVLVCLTIILMPLLASLHGGWTQFGKTVWPCWLPKSSQANWLGQPKKNPTRMSVYWWAILWWQNQRGHICNETHKWWICKQTRPRATFHWTQKLVPDTDASCVIVWAKAFCNSLVDICLRDHKLPRCPYFKDSPGIEHDAQRWGVCKVPDLHILKAVIANCKHIFPNLYGDEVLSAFEAQPDDIFIFHWQKLLVRVCLATLNDLFTFRMGQ